MPNRRAQLLADEAILRLFDAMDSHILPPSRAKRGDRTVAAGFVTRPLA
jgi:hypothetical protein